MFNYDDIGGKIKNLAKAIFFTEAVGSIITGLIFLFSWGFKDAWWALFIIFLGPIVAWVGSWLVYGFGELVDKTCDIERNTRDKTKSEAQAKADLGRISKLEKLRAQGLITEEEYKKAISKEKQGDVI